MDINSKESAPLFTRRSVNSWPTNYTALVLPVARGEMRQPYCTPMSMVTEYYQPQAAPPAGP
jgi:hypothetical protein